MYTWCKNLTFYPIKFTQREQAMNPARTKTILQIEHHCPAAQAQLQKGRQTDGKQNGIVRQQGQKQLQRTGAVIGKNRDEAAAHARRLRISQAVLPGDDRMQIFQIFDILNVQVVDQKRTAAKRNEAQRRENSAKQDGCAQKREKRPADGSQSAHSVTP